MKVKTMLLIFAFALLQGLSVFGSNQAFANSGLSLDQAKASGVVGEQSDGYLGAVSSSPSGEVQALVSSINQKRKEKYQSIAQRRGTSLKAVEALAGKTAIEKTEAGQYVNLGSGWQRK